MTGTKLGILACSAIVSIGITARAQSADRYPSQPIKIVVAQAPGSGVDLTARLIARKMSDGLGQSVYVENHPGANGIIGAEYVAKAKGDGYTMLMAVPSLLTVNPFIYKHLPYDTFKDYAAVTQTHTIPFSLVVNAKSDVKTVPDLVRFAKSKPGGLNYSSGGVGNLNQLAAVLFSDSAHIKMVQVPNRGEGPAIIDLVGNHTDLMFATLPTASPLIASGQLRLLATLGKARDPSFPNVPTLVELGYPDVLIEGWGGLVVPKSTPAKIVDTLQQEIAKDLKYPDVRQALRQQGAIPVGSKPAVYAAFLRAEAKKYERVTAAAGLHNTQ